MKKFLAMMLAVLMLLSMATVAMAENLGSPTQNDKGWNMGYLRPGATFNLKLEYTNAASAPGESFEFVITAKDGAPAITDYTSSVANTFGTGLANNGTISVTLPEYTVPGTYVYEIQQTAPSADNAKKGVTYDTVVRKMYVYVENNMVSGTDGEQTTDGLKCQVAVYEGEKAEANKCDTFHNVYTAGSLKITKKVESDTGDFFDGNTAQSHDYKFKFTFNNLNNGNNYYTYTKHTAPATVGGAWTDMTGDVSNLEGSFTLRDGEYIVFNNLPVTATYEVYEEDDSPKHQDGTGTYTSSMTSDSKTTGSIANANLNPEATCTNTFEYKNNLSITKKVTGTAGNHGATFTVKVTFSGKGLDVMAGKTYGVTSSKGTEKPAFSPAKNAEDKYEYTFTVSDGETVTIAGLPQNVTYYVEEVGNEQHTPKYDDYRSGTLTNTDASTTITNDKGIDIPTGVALDTLPYVLVLALAGAGLVLMIARKRRVED